MYYLIINCNIWLSKSIEHQSIQLDFNYRNQIKINRCKKVKIRLPSIRVRLIFIYLQLCSIVFSFNSFRFNKLCQIVTLFDNGLQKRLKKYKKQNIYSRIYCNRRQSKSIEADKIQPTSKKVKIRLTFDYTKSNRID